jgi:hypothetical protein
LTHVVQQTGEIQQQKKEQNPTVTPQERPILEGTAPRSNVLSHLQSLGENAGHNSLIYRKEILQFQRENSSEKIAASQQKVLDSQKSVNIQHKDNSPTLRRRVPGQANQSTPQSTFKKGETLAINFENTQGWLEGRRGNSPTGEILSLPNHLKVQYQERRGGRDYMKILEGKENGEMISLFIGYLTRQKPWQGSVAVTFNEKTGILNYGAGTAKAIISVNPNNPSAPKIALNRAYPLWIPDHPHAVSPSYGAYATVWFRIEGGPQGDEYLHRGQVSWGCVTVQDNSWPSIYKHLINKRSGNKYVGTIKRINQ